MMRLESHSDSTKAWEDGVKLPSGTPAQKRSIDGSIKNYFSVVSDAMLQSSASIALLIDDDDDDDADGDNSDNDDDVGSTKRSEHQKLSSEHSGNLYTRVSTTTDSKLHDVEREYSASKREDTGHSKQICATSGILKKKKCSARVDIPALSKGSNSSQYFTCVLKKSTLSAAVSNFRTACIFDVCPHTLP